MFHNAASNAAEWSALEEYLKSVVPEPVHSKKPLQDYQISDKIKQQHKEYQLCGKSGAGKSTFMLKEVMKLYRNYTNGWLYLDQQMSVPKSTCTTIRQFLCNFINENLHNSQHTEQTIIYWASFLQLSNIINLNTLDSSFTSPSGGEVKRINSLQMLLPIFMNQIKIKVLFLDEVTSGLDDETHSIVRKLIEQLKNEYNITVINIDHHTYDEGQCKLNVIKIRDGICPYDEVIDISPETSESLIAKCFTSCGSSYKYIKQEKEKKELSFPPEIVIESL